MRAKVGDGNGGDVVVGSVVVVVVGTVVVVVVVVEVVVVDVVGSLNVKERSVFCKHNLKFNFVANNRDTNYQR